jgi:hypothetical protein
MDRTPWSRHNLENIFPLWFCAEKYLHNTSTKQKHKNHIRNEDTTRIPPIIYHNNLWWPLQSSEKQFHTHGIHRDENHTKQT